MNNNDDIQQSKKLSDTQAKKERTRRRIIPTKTQSTEVVVIPSVETLLDDAKAIIGSELAQYRSKTKRGVTLDPKEARVVTGYLDALTRASKEAREAARSHDLSSFSDEELIQLLTSKKSGKPSDD
jgi:hypothetical protein